MPPIATLDDALRQAAAGFGDDVAFKFRQESISFRALDERATELAVALRSLGIEQGDRVGIFLGKGLESIIAVYGIMRSGAAWVPLDPRLPELRQQRIIDNCGIRHLISDDRGHQQLQRWEKKAAARLTLLGTDGNGGDIQCFGWSAISARHATADAHARSLPQLGPEDLAYIMVTSGSTGEPKGICHSHGSGLAYAQAAVDAFLVRDTDVLSGFPPLNFDQCTFHLFAGMLSGAITILIPEEFGSFPVNLGRLIQDEKITIWYSVPFVLIQLEARGEIESLDLSALRWVKFGGEVFPVAALAALMDHLPKARFANIYGPAEVNQCTHHVLDCPPQAGETVPIGKPWDIAELLVLDPHGREVAAGEDGELLVRSSTMMQGYWNQPELNSRCFYSSALHPGGRYYRTGDQVRRSTGGALEFLGRTDRQVKTRGYRVELDEIEAAILTHPASQEAAVLLMDAPDGSQVLEAFLTLRSSQTLSAVEMLQFLAKRLPRYALPASIRFVEDFPRTASGKIDRRVLTQPRPAATAGPTTTETTSA